MTANVLDVNFLSNHTYEPTNDQDMELAVND